MCYFLESTLDLFKLGYTVLHTISMVPNDEENLLISSSFLTTFMFD